MCYGLGYFERERDFSVLREREKDISFELL